jgi:hypothetical protein
VDSKTSPSRSYAQVVAVNRFEVLSDPEQDDKEMTETHSSEVSDMTPKQDNAKPSSSNDKEKYLNPLSTKSQRKMAKTAKKDVKKITLGKTCLLSSATRATLEGARKAKELLKINSGSLQEDESDISDTPMQDKQISQDLEEEEPADLDKSSFKTNEDIIQENPKEDREGQDNSHISATKENSTSTPNSEKSKTSHQPQRGTKISNPYLKSWKPMEQDILHAMPQRINNTKTIITFRLS